MAGTLIVIGSLNYPQGSAPTSRIHLYCKALIESGSRAFVLCLQAPFTSEPKFPVFGTYEKVPYFYTQRNYIRNKSFLIRNWKKIVGAINAIALIINIRKRNPKCAILFFSTTFVHEMIFKVFANIYRIPTIREVNEVPEFIGKNDRFRIFHRFVSKHFRFHLYSSIIVISQNLKTLYSSLCKNILIFKIPILVNFNRFDNIRVRNFDKNCISYIGYMGGNKDGVLDLLSSFSIVLNNYPKVKLNLIGGAPEDEIQKIRKKIKSLRIEESVCLLGQIEVNEVPHYLKSSRLLVLSRPNNLQAHFGFPTKLGEYLAAKRPVVITRTGEIPNYLSDRFSAYIADPGNINDIASKIIEALEDENSESIAQNGYDIALKNFNYKNYATILNNLISDLHK